jgi:hypothetical protein
MRRGYGPRQVRGDLRRIDREHRSGVSVLSGLRRPAGRRALTRRSIRRRAQAQGLAERYRAQVERSAFNTLALLVRPLGYSNLEVRFASKQELSTDVGMASLTQSDPAVAMPVPAGDALLTARGRSASS